uniref:transglycosylase domain-containing protein n=1 Tax=Desertibaculum subflavum TaxID=2268458 RepID=UPI000E65F4B5
GGAAARERPAAPSPRRPKRGGGRGRRILWRLAGWAFVLAIWAAVGAAALIGFFAYDLPDVERLNRVERQPSLTLVAADGSTVGTYGDLYGDMLTPREIPEVMKRAVVAIEDHRFYGHFGLDPLGLVRAIYVNFRAGRLAQGGSTITQQLAKNVFLTPERSLKRKVQEAMLALWLEHRFSKDQILAMYLNRIYFGAGTWGIDAAAQRYFAKSARQVTLAEAAMVAGLVKAPSRYSPTADLKRAQARASVVIDRMAEEGLIRPEAAARAKAAPAELAASRQPSRNARYFADWAADMVDDFAGRGFNDLVVVTTLDPRLQQAAEATLTQIMEQEGPKADAAQAALVALSPDGAVKAMVGGLGYRDSAFNRATQAKRQPGSAFKLFVYLAGFEAGLRPDDLMFDGPMSIGGWTPRNYEGKYFGEVTLREAFTRSLNTVAVQLSERAGLPRVIDVAHRLGINEAIPANASIALGTKEVSLTELTGAFAVMANGGRGVIPYGITEVRTREGRVVYRRQGGGPGRVLDPGVHADMQTLLAAVVQSPNGTGYAARLDRPAFGKTGTTQDNRDAWFVGYTPDLVAGVWVGNDDDSPMKRVTGGSIPARLWKTFMMEALKGTAPSAPVVAERREPPPGEQTLWQKIVREFGGSGGAGRQASAPSPRRERSTLERPIDQMPFSTD